MMHDTTSTDEPLTWLLRRLGPTSDAAGEAYESLRRLLCRYFEVRGCRDATVLADEVIDRMSRRLSEGVEIADAGAYARGIARLVLLEARRRPADEPLVADPAADPHDDSTGREHTAACLERCLEQLDATVRSHVLTYYAADGRGRIDGRRRLAAQLGVSATALRLRMLRVRLSLEHCVRRCAGGGLARNTQGSGGTER
jgi:DNA-directed RNA polymerase specialized sigma24 family protein